MDTQFSQHKLLKTLAFTHTHTHTHTILAVLSKINWPYIHMDLFQGFFFHYHSTSVDLCLFLCQ